MPDLQKLQADIRTVMSFIAKITRPNRYFFDKDVEFGPTIKLFGAIYGGSVFTGGTSAGLPTGWTSVKAASGQYTVTHNLGTSSYAVVATTISVNTRALSTVASTNSFTVYAGNATNSGPEDNPFTFILFRT